jgi:hypothetical protein
VRNEKSAGMLQETIANTKCEDNLIGTANARGVNNQFQALDLDIDLGNLHLGHGFSDFICSYWP